ncbi:uncharacterized protein LOC135496810 [Lineus longissimus]|uniref:uncharacterized protein LOC135496810 n=1 Tax=Lineus longissimus TaxID=88925 RepID=UPI002B4DFE13
MLKHVKSNSNSNMLDTKYLKHEVELTQRHQEIILRREALLNGTEAFYDDKDDKSGSFIGTYNNAIERNQLLLQDMRQFSEEMKMKKRAKEDPRFTTLKNNYWSMVKNIFPVWSEEMREYKRRRNTPRSNRSVSEEASELDLMPENGYNLDISEADFSNLSPPQTGRSSKSVTIDPNLPESKSSTKEKKKKKGLFGLKSPR